MSITLVEASKSDIPVLLKMNKHLMEDEQFDRPLNDENLKKRWNELIDIEKYKVLLFKNEEDTIGYAVVHTDQDPLYLRHFFIGREFRRKGYGRNSFQVMLNYLNASEIDIEVMTWNNRGLHFWKSLGFRERCIAMTFSK